MRLIFSNCLHSAYNSLPKFFALYVAFHNCGTVCSSILWNWIFTNNSGALNSLLRGQDIEQWIIIYSSAYTCCFFLCRIWQSHINLHEFWACESVWFLSCFVQYWPLLRSFWILHVRLMLPLLLWLCPLENSHCYLSVLFIMLISQVASTTSNMHPMLTDVAMTVPVPYLGMSCASTCLKNFCDPYTALSKTGVTLAWRKDGW